MGHEWASRGPSGEPDDANDMLTRVVVERWFEESLRWVDRRAEETEEWAEAAVLHERLLYLDPAELEDLNRRLDELLEPYVHRGEERGAGPAAARAVTFIQLGFPLEEEDPVDEDAA
jgi:hypothetical protein